MLGLIVLAVVGTWLTIAIWPFKRIRRNYPKGHRMRRWGLAWLLLILFGPFWDYFLMVPAIHYYYATMSRDVVNTTSDARSVFYRPISDWPQIDGPLYLVYQGKLDFIESYSFYRDDAPRGTTNIFRHERALLDSEACRTRAIPLRFKTEKWCITERIVEAPEAEVIMEWSDFGKEPYPFLKKGFGYTVLRFRDRKTEEVIAEGVYGFGWSPWICKFSPAPCRYGVDDGAPSSNVLNRIENAVPNAIVKY